MLERAKRAWQRALVWLGQDYDGTREGAGPPKSYVPRLRPWRDRIFADDQEFCQRFKGLTHDGLQRVLGSVIGSILLLFLWIMYAGRAATVEPIFKSISAHIFLLGYGDWFVWLLSAATVCLCFYAGRSWGEWALSSAGALGLAILVLFPVAARPDVLLVDSSLSDHVRIIAEVDHIQALHPSLSVDATKFCFNETGFSCEALTTVGDKANGDRREALYKSFQWFPWVNFGHYLGGAIFFTALFGMTALVFTRWHKDDLKTIGTYRLKNLRNGAYYALSVGMFIALIGTFQKDFFLGEMLALLMFAVAWVIKGRFFWPLIVYFVRRARGLRADTAN